MMLRESSQNPYNIVLKNVVKTMIKIAIEITNDFDCLQFLEKWRHAHPIAQDVRTPCVITWPKSTNENTSKKWYNPVYLLSPAEQWAYQAFRLNQ